MLNANNSKNSTHAQPIDYQNQETTQVKEKKQKVGMKDPKDSSSTSGKGPYSNLNVGSISLNPLAEEAHVYCYKSGLATIFFSK